MSRRELPRLLLEHADELLADALALLFRVCGPDKPREETCTCVDVDEGDVKMAVEGLDDLESLILAKKAVVDEDAGQLVADRLVDKQSRHRRVDAAGKGAEDPSSTDLGPDSLDLDLDHGGRRPGRRGVCGPVEEVLQDLHAVHGVRDLGMELDTVKPAVRVLECGDGSRGRARDDHRSRWSRGDRVTVAHPGDLTLRHAGKEDARRLRLDLGTAKFRLARPIDATPEVARHQLHAVANPEDGDPQPEYGCIDLRCPLRVDRGGPARQHERPCPAPDHFVGVDRGRNELRVDATLANSPRNQLRVLATQVDDENWAVLGHLLRGRRLRRGRSAQRDDLSSHVTYPGGSSGTPS